jgi:hypothetical protein
MPNVTVTNPSIVTVRVGTAQQPRVQSTATFFGSSANLTNEINSAIALAQGASAQANLAYNVAIYASNTANNALPITGGTVTGNLTVLGAFAANAEVFMVLDGGNFT